MIREGDEAKGILDCPELYFTVIATSSNHGAIRRVGHRVKVEEVSLLLENVRLTLPLPDEKLTLFLAAHSDPISLCVYRDTIYLVSRDLERVN